MNIVPPEKAFGVLQQTFVGISADEGTLWLLDEERRALIPVWNSGPHAGELVGKYVHPLDSGLISLVCVAEQSICENQVYAHKGQDPTLDRTLGLLTCSMIAVPYRPGGVIKGVVSCVKLKPATDRDRPDPPPFNTEDLNRMIKAVQTLEAILGSGPSEGQKDPDQPTPESR